MEVLNRQAEVNFQGLSSGGVVGGIANNRPHTAMASSEQRRTLGSMCPVIIKHEFPNEQKHYIDNVGQEMSSTKKRFIYDRPNTAKLHRSGGALHATASSGNIAPQSAGPTTQQHRSMSGQSGFPGSAFLANRSASHAQLAPASATAAGGTKPSSAAGLNSADLYSKLLEGQKIKKESRFVIKPARKLNTFQIHSALYKIKKQKEELDGKIRDLEDLKKNFNEMDFYLIANSGAVDYLLNQGGTESAVQGPTTQTLHPEQSNHFLSFESEEHPTDSQIVSLAEINQNHKRKQNNINNRPMSSVPQKKTSFTNLNPQKSRASTAKPKAVATATTTTAINNNNNNNSNVNQSNSSNNAGGVSGNSRDQIEMLRGESRDESRDQLGSFDLELLGTGGAMRLFQGHERNQVKHWGENIDQPGSVKDSIENIGENLASINQLLAPKRASTAQQTNHPIGAIQEEEDDDAQFHVIEDHTNTNNPNTHFYNTAEENRNLPYEQYIEQQQQLLQQQQHTETLTVGGHNQYNNLMQHYHSQSNLHERPHTANTNNPQLQMPPTGIFPSFSKKKNSMKRVQSAKISQGQFRPFSGAPGISTATGSTSSLQPRPFSSMVSPVSASGSGNLVGEYQQFLAMHSRPQTTSSNRLHSATLSGSMSAKASHHALMSYGNVQVVKESIKRNYDHLELLAENEHLERAKKAKEKRVVESKQDWQNLKVSGSRLPISSDNLIDLVKQTQDAISKYQSVSSHQSNPSSKVMQVSLSGSATTPATFAPFFGNSAVTTMSHMYGMKQSNESNTNFNIHVQGVVDEDHTQYEDNQSLTYSQSVAQYNQEGLDSLGQLHSTVSRGTLDFNSAQLHGTSKSSLRPSTAKPQSSFGSNQTGGGGSKRMLNVPVAESIAYRHPTEDSNSNSSGMIMSFQGLQLTQQQSHVLHLQEQLQAAAQNFENIQALSLLQSQSNQYSHRNEEYEHNDGVREYLEEQKEDISEHQNESVSDQLRSAAQASVEGQEEEQQYQSQQESQKQQPQEREADDFLVESNDQSEDADQFENISYATKKSKFSNRPTTAYQPQ